MKIFNDDWAQVSQRHDLIIAIGTLEMALEQVRLQPREDECERLIPQIEAQLQKVSDKLEHLAT